MKILPQVYCNLCGQLTDMKFMNAHIFSDKKGNHEPLTICNVCETHICKSIDLAQAEAWT